MAGVASISREEALFLAGLADENLFASWLALERRGDWLVVAVGCCADVRPPLPPLVVSRNEKTREVRPPAPRPDGEKTVTERTWRTYRVVWLLGGSPCSSTDGMARDSAIHTARNLARQPRTSDVRIESRQHVATVTEFAVNDEATKEALSDV